jgi:hypothetical protein
MSPQPTLYSLSPDKSGSGVVMAQTWAQSGGGPLDAEYKHLVPLPVGGRNLLLAVAQGGKASVFTVADGGAGLTETPSSIDFAADFDVLEPFILGMATYVLGYTASSGNMSFFTLGEDLTLGSTPYQFSRTRPPSISKNFTVTKPIVINGLVYILAYAMSTGAVDAYSLAVTSTPQPGAPQNSPPLLATPVWDHEWAREWTHFAFFTLGSENFFFKINVGPKPNVNIDHVVDTPALGTVEVGTYLELEDSATLAIVRSFSLEGDPYFITYKSDGTTVVRRFRGDCQGWSQQAAMTTVAGASEIVPISVGDDQVVALFF